MSTATLLILSARLREHGRGGPPRVADRAAGRERARRHPIRHGQAGESPFVPAPCGRATPQLASADTRISLARVRVLVAMLLLPGLSGIAAWASTAWASTGRIGGTTPPAPCVTVDVGGHKVGHLDCATQKLEQAARDAQAEARAGQDIAVPQAGSPDVAVGVSSLTGSRLRMGNSLGQSVHPQRPVRPAIPSRPGPLP